MSRRKKYNEDDNLDEFFQLDIKGGMIPNSIVLNGVLTHLKITGVVKLLKKKDDGHGLVDYKLMIPFIIPVDFTVDEISEEILLHCNEGVSKSKYKGLQFAKLYINAVYVVNGGNSSICITTKNGVMYMSLDGKTPITENEKGMIEDIEKLGILKYIDGIDRDPGSYWDDSEDDYPDDYPDDDEDY